MTKTGISRISSTCTHCCASFNWLQITITLTKQNQQNLTDVSPQSSEIDFAFSQTYFLQLYNQQQLLLPPPRDVRSQSQSADASRENVRQTLKWSRSTNDAHFEVVVWYNQQQQQTSEVRWWLTATTTYNYSFQFSPTTSQTFSFKKNKLKV